ncbi:nucleoside diphosphate kinase [Streptococcus henryi]|jgi:nucleoside-diphosphate kinase|uniref:Nucleoside diphosphate kinase n=1 Tax=Streptococcus henryi TaxID=439219 RepID=A0A1G6C9V0_9STRE|nr:nucleoside-diphosphate kinase [Streptococcus henryi]SDB29592.1 nucleoside diphosphate kinase [Streptococcus henryi]
MTEKTFFMIKPDGVERRLIGEIIHLIERRGFTIERLELRMATEDILRQHYSHLVDKPFFGDILGYMLSGPVLIGVISGPKVVKSWRIMMGATNPVDAVPGSIRGDFAMGPVDGNIKNVVHGSDSKEAAQREIALWFGQSNN